MMIQNYLHKLYKLEDKYNMKFNVTFELLRYGKEHAGNKICDSLQIMMIQILTSKQVRYLCIMMSNTTTFTLHMKNEVIMARDKLGWVLRVFQSRKRCLMLMLLKSFVIPLLEYCCQLWNPYKRQKI